MRVLRPEVRGILDRNKLLINEINYNHDGRNPEGLQRNVVLIRELNDNIRQVGHHLWWLAVCGVSHFVVKTSAFLGPPHSCHM